MEPTQLITLNPQTIEEAMEAAALLADPPDDTKVVVMQSGGLMADICRRVLAIEARLAAPR